jgi:hypothetical protein
VGEECVGHGDYLGNGQFDFARETSNLSCKVIPLKSVRTTPALSGSVMSRGERSLLCLSKELSLPRHLVYLSTSDVYGDSGYFYLHSREGGNPEAYHPRNASPFFDLQPFWLEETYWIPAFAGMTQRRTDGVQHLYVKT